MIIGIEAERANHPEKTGVEHYAKQLIVHLAQIDHTNQYRLYLRTAPEQWILDLPKNFEYKVMPFPKFWTQIRVSFELLMHPVDRLLVPASAIPFIHPQKSVCTIHDAAFLYYPEADTDFMRNFLDKSYKYISKKAWKIIAISEATKQDLVTHYGTDPKKITVIHHGFEPNNQEVKNDQVVNAELPEKFILFVSTLQPRKNLEGLIRAFRVFKNNHPDDQHKLVVIGKKGWKFESIIKAIEANKDIVTYLGHVSDEVKQTAYKKATAFINPSFYEGFGMWILEAFDAGIPVATSHVSSLPEIGGDAALYFDPHEEIAITKTIEQLITDPVLRTRMVGKGKNRLRDFSWENVHKKP